MNIKVLFFANFREQLNESTLSVEIETGNSVEDLCLLLASRGERWQAIFGQASASVKVAVNQEVADMQSKLNQGDEVAFFPPVTGG